MFISALLIVGGLLVVILGLSGEILDATTGIIAGTVLFVFGLVVLRRQKSESGHLESNGSNERPAVSNAADQTSSQPDEQVAPSTVPVDEVDQDEEDTISTGESTAQQSEDPEGSGEDENEEEARQIVEAYLAQSNGASDESDNGEGDLNYVKAANVSEVKPGACHSVEIDGIAIALFNLDGEYYALRDNCSHARARLSAGEVEGNEVVCPLHGATFSIKTGEATGPPAYSSVKSYPIRVTGEEIEIAV